MMHLYNLGFISDSDIYRHVKDTVEAYRREITLDQFNENIIDPIKLTFDAKVYGKTIRQAVEDECFRQVDKSNTNRIGYFHQNPFRYAGNGWTVPATGFDVENQARHIFVEMKNKHNTMNSVTYGKTYIKMQCKLLEDDEATCYLVDFHAKNRLDELFAVEIDGCTTKNKRIRRISLDRLYAIVFGYENALSEICAAVPQIIDDVIADSRDDNNTFSPQTSMLTDTPSYGSFYYNRCDSL